MSFEDFLFLALAAILFNGGKPLWPSWISHRQNFSLFLIQKSYCSHRASFGSKGPKVWEEMLKIDFHNGGYGGHLGFSIGLFSYFASTKHPDAHHQISVQLDYRFIMSKL